LPGGNGRDSGIAGWENMGMEFKFQMGMKSLKWDGIGTKNLFPHTSTHNQGRRQVKICGVDRHGECQPITGVWRRSDPPTRVKTRRICINFTSDL